MKAIEVQGVSKTYGDQRVLSDIYFDAARGECLGIIGPNGSGKSTLLRIISGGMEPDQGRIFVDNVPIRRYKGKSLARKMAVLPQGGLYAYPVSVYDTVMMGRYPFLRWLEQEGAADAAIVRSVMEETGITHLADKKLDELSGGELQRVAIARTLAQSPEILLLDEPTTFLDIGHQIAILDILTKWRTSKNATLILVLHDLNLAARYCDRILLMEGGAIRKWGTCEDVFHTEILEPIYGVSPLVIRHPVSNVPQIIL